MLLLFRTHLAPVALHWAACALLLCAAPAVQAEKADRSQPMNAEADALRYDEIKQSSVFTGNVIVSQGTLLIRADRVEVRQDKEGYQIGTATSTGSKRAFFRQKRDALDEWIEGEAESIVYDGKADMVTFSKNASMRRLRGTTMADEAHGAKITYDNTTETFSVAGGSGSGSAATGNPSGRVRAVISPRAATPALGASLAPVPAGASLRPSSSLGAGQP